MSESSEPTGSFSKGLGQWLGTAEVYGPDGVFLGEGRDTRSVEADDGAGTVTVNVSFEGPFSMAGQYTIADRGTHRLYQGPLNYGFAEVLGDGLVCAHNYWANLGMSQRVFLMVLPDGTRQLSLALISRAEVLKYVVVGEYLRQTDAMRPAPLPAARHEGADEAEMLLRRPGSWVGELTVLDGDLAPIETVEYCESIAQTAAGLDVSVEGVHFGRDTSYSLVTTPTEAWTPTGDVLGSLNMVGGRGQSGYLLHHREETRVWLREVAALDGTMKGVVQMWYRGEQRIGAMYGALSFEGV